MQFNGSLKALCDFVRSLN